MRIRSLSVFIKKYSQNLETITKFRNIYTHLIKLLHTFVMKYMTTLKTLNSHANSYDMLDLCKVCDLCLIFFLQKYDSQRKE